jgi:hypothetical protein
MPPPDPVSVAWERDAGRFLARVYAGKGDWVTHLIFDPPPAHVKAWARHGIDVTAADPVPRRLAKTRWIRGYVRALYRLNKEGRRRALEFQVGRRRPPAGALGWRTPVRMRTRPGGRAAAKAVAAKPLSQRIYGEDGQPGALWADPARRDW